MQGEFQKLFLCFIFPRIFIAGFELKQLPDTGSVRGATTKLNSIIKPWSG